MQIITVANGKGGVGKTTSSIYLSLAAHKEQPDAKVLLLDLDPQRSALEWSNLAEDVGDALPFEVKRGSLQTLHALQGYDYVIVDVAPAVSDSALRTLSGLSDLVIVPTEAEGLGLSKTYQTVDVCKGKAIVLLTRIRPRTRIYADAIAALDEADVPRFEMGIPDSVRYKSYGITPTTIGEYGGVWQEIQQEIKQ